MGWKSACLFVGDIESGYFGTSPTHSPEKARTILQALGADPQVGGTKNFAEIYPPEGEIFIGAFERGAFISYLTIMDDLETGNEDFLRRAMTCYPDGDLLALGLHSVVNFAAFAYYKKSQLIRTFACAADPGVIREQGTRLPEEEKQYVNSFERDNVLVFPREIGSVTEEFDISGVAEDIIFDLSARPLGKRFDYLGEDVFETESFSFRKLSKGGKASNLDSKPFWKFW